MKTNQFSLQDATSTRRDNFSSHIVQQGVPDFRHTVHPNIQTKGARQCSFKKRLPFDKEQRQKQTTKAKFEITFARFPILYLPTNPIRASKNIEPFTTSIFSSNCLIILTFNIHNHLPSLNYIIYIATIR